jgi:nitrogen fixation protein NifU and related proteins
MITGDIIKIAANTSNYGLINKSKYRASLKNKFCGDTITVEAIIKNGILERMHYETESCIFCQASASLLSRTELKQILFTKEHEVPEINPCLKELKKILNIKNKDRFKCILLPLNALHKAISA